MSDATAPSTPLTHPRIGLCGPVAVQLDDECEQATCFVARISVQNSEVVRSLGPSAVTTVVQRSPCIICVTVSGISQDIVFPYPVRGNNHQLRLDPQSLYIEVC